MKPSLQKKPNVNIGLFFYSNLEHIRSNEDQEENTKHQEPF